MKMNSDQSTDKKRLGAVCRFIGVLFGLLVFIWLPPAEVTASDISGVVRDSVTNDPLPGAIIILNDSFTTVSKGAPEEGVYSINHSGSICSLSAMLDGYEPFTLYPSSDWAQGFCPDIEEWDLDIDMVKHVIPYSTSMQLITPSGLIENPRVFRWTPSANLAVVSYRLIISGDPNVYFSPTGIDVIAPQAIGRTSPDHDFWRVFGLDQFGNPVEQTQEIFEVWSTSQENRFTVISGLVKSDRNQVGLAGARVAVSSFHTAIDSSMVTVFNGEYIVIALSGDKSGSIPGPIEITSTKDGFHPTTAIVKVGQDTRDLDLPMRSITDNPLPSLQLRSPPDGRQTNPVTVFRWMRSEYPEVHSYRLLIALDQDMVTRVLDLPGAGDNKIIAPQIAVRLWADDGHTDYFWRVIALDQSGNPVEQSQNIFSFSHIGDPSGYTVITGRVKSGLNQLGQSGARVAVSSALHSGTLNNIVETEFNGEYSVIARTTDSNGDPIPFPIEITSSKEGFQPTTVTLQESEIINGTITHDLVMKADSDGDGGSDGGGAGDGNGRATDPSLNTSIYFAITVGRLAQLHWIPRLMLN